MADRPAGAPATARSNAQEVLAALAVRESITTVPASVARLAVGALSAIVAVSLRDADPATIALVGREDRRSVHVDALRAFAMRGAAPDPSQPRPAGLLNGLAVQR